MALACGQPSGWCRDATHDGYGLKASKARIRVRDIRTPLGPFFRAGASARLLGKKRRERSNTKRREKKEEEEEEEEGIHGREAGEPRGEAVLFCSVVPFPFPSLPFPSPLGYFALSLSLSTFPKNKKNDSDYHPNKGATLSIHTSCVAQGPCIRGGGRTERTAFLTTTFPSLSVSRDRGRREAGVLSGPPM